MPTPSIASRSTARTMPSASVSAAVSTRSPHGDRLRPAAHLSSATRSPVTRARLSARRADCRRHAERRSGLRAVRRSHRRSRDVVLRQSRPADRPTSARCGSRTLRTSVCSPTPSRSATASRRRLSLEDGQERRDRGIPFNLGHVPEDIRDRLRSTLRVRRPADAGRRRVTSGTPVPGARRSSRAPSTRSATFGGLAGGINPVLNPITGLPNAAFADTEYGFAVALETGINLPWSSARATRPGWRDLHGWCARLHPRRPFGWHQRHQFSHPPADGRLREPGHGRSGEDEGLVDRGWLHPLLDAEFRSSLFGSYARFDVPGSATFVVPVNTATIDAGTAGTTVGFVDFNEYRLGANTFWTPVPAPEPRRRGPLHQARPEGPRLRPGHEHCRRHIGGKPSGGEDIWEGRLRIQRDF